MFQATSIGVEKMVKSLITSVVVIGLSFMSSNAFAVTDTYSYTGSQESFVVPAGANKITIEAWGAAGGHSGIPGDEGLGGEAIGTLAVSPGDTLYINVGGAGINGTSAQNCGVAGGYNGGGPTGTTCCSNAGDGAGSGGGASDVRLNGSGLSERVIVAAGGGGGGSRGINGVAGAGGGLLGDNGGTFSAVTATGGTQIAGGTAGGHFTGHLCSAGTDGSFGVGGMGDGNDGGGSGGGWYGGGGGPNNGGGAGGSSYIDDPDLSAESTRSGVRAGDGEIRLTYDAEHVPVPTMTQWGTIVLIVLMGLLVFSRRRKI